MSGATGPRFLLEAGFLVLLAVVLGLADLSPVLIIVVMGLAWVLVSLIEYFAWRQGPRFPARFATATEPAARIDEEEIVMAEPAPVPPPAPRPAEEQTAVAPPTKEPPAQPEPAAQGQERLQFEAEERASHRLEPLQPRPRRRWVVFGPRERQGEEPGSREEGP
jgi:hypothetical protein